MNDSVFAGWEAAVEQLLSQPENEDLCRACYYDRPAIEAARRYASSEEWAALRAFMPKGAGRALDLGAGMGIASYALARDGWQTVALEPNPGDLVGAGAIRSLAHAANLKIEVVQEWGEALPFQDHEFDLIHARQVLHHARDLDRLCQELLRVLRPGGYLLATREHVISSSEQLQPFLDRHPLHRLYGGENAFTLSQYLGALKAAGFRVDKNIGPFDSAINLSPMTPSQLCDEIVRRARVVPGGGLVARLILARPWRGLAFRLLSRFDRRPGRLHTFIAQRPSIEA